MTDLANRFPGVASPRACSLPDHEHASGLLGDRNFECGTGNSSAPRKDTAPTASGAPKDAVPMKQFGKYRIPTHWKVDTTLAESETKIGIIGHPCPSQSARPAAEPFAHDTLVAGADAAEVLEAAEGVLDEVSAANTTVA